MDINKVSTINVQIPGMGSTHRIDFTPQQKQISLAGQYHHFLKPFQRHTGEFQMSLGGIPYTSTDGVNYSPAKGQVNRELVKLPNKFLANTVGKVLHKWPVWTVSGVLSAIGGGLILRQLFNPAIENGIRSYQRQNPIDSEKVFNHEMSAEIHLLLSAPLDAIPVRKRQTWELLGNVEPIYHKLNGYGDLKTTEAQDLYKQFLAESYQVVFERALALGKITPEEKEFQQGAILAVNDLPQPKPLTKREFPDIQRLSFVNQNVQAPAADAARADFVAYYAQKYNVDL